MMLSGFDIKDLEREAQSRWLKPAEVLFILQNHQSHKITQVAPKNPTSGALFLFNKRVLRFFRKDGHNWRKKRDGRTVGEAHERLKVGNAEALNCYYAHGEENPNFQRRSYWMLDSAHEHIVLVHYRDITEGRQSGGPLAQFSPGLSPTLSQSPSSYNTQNPGSPSVSGLYESFNNISSPGSVEVSSGAVIYSNGVDNLDRIDKTGEYSSSSDHEVTQALRRLEEQLSLNDDGFQEIESLRRLEQQLSLDDDTFQEIEAFHNQNEELIGFNYQENDSEISKQEQLTALLNGSQYVACGYDGMQDNSKKLTQDAGNYHENQQYSFLHEDAIKNRGSLSWTEVLEFSESSSADQAKYLHISNENEKPQSFSRNRATEEKLKCHWLSDDGDVAENSSVVLPQVTENFQFPALPSVISTQPIDPGYDIMSFDQSQTGVQPEGDSSLTISQIQKFTIREVSPEWGYSTEATKVMIVGSFLCDPWAYTWTCMFGDSEVPIQIIQEGVILCQAPPHLPGNVSLCITSGNRESCSEVREFEYRSRTDSRSFGHIPHTEATKSPDELLLLVRFAQMLLCDPYIYKGDILESEINDSTKLKADEDTWSFIIEALSVGNGTLTSTMDWLLQELLKDKFQQWLSSRNKEQGGESGCLLSRKEQGIIHSIAGLGYEWALNPILGAGVSINFRDINGWTALHWAARFGRERMVAALIASGASAGAVTDPNKQDPTGKTPAFIAASSGHKGLAGYLSEVAVTSHLSSLTLEESELTKGSAEVEAENTVNSISTESLDTGEDQLSLKETLAAVRNVAQAAARIQSAFRSHSFRKRQVRDATVSATVNEYGTSSEDIQGISAVSKLAFRNTRDYNSAALSIQKKYRGWKGRKDFLAFRQKVVKIQAHVRGHQVRKNYKVICWAVGILEKVVLRWRRKGVGLRGFRSETEPIEESDEEDVAKLFRKQKVDAAIDEAVSRVLSMVESPNARQQYRRMLEKYREAKAQLKSAAGASTSATDLFDMDRSF